MLKRLTSSGILILFAAFIAPAQVTLGGNCSGCVFGASEVAKRARILKRPNLDLIQSRGTIRGRLVIDAVLCRSGHVTDIRVKKGISPEIDQLARAAVYTVKFEPAEYRWHTVSQKVTFEINIGTSDEKTARLVESVEVIGNRRLTKEQIFFWVETRPGDTYNEEQLARDFEAILASGYFDKTQTRVTTELAIRGGIAVAFYVVELPLIGEINFEGLKVERSKIIDALKREDVNLQPETPYDPVAVKKAARIIEFFFASTGQGDLKVEPSIEQVTSQKINITFVITPNQ